MTECHFNLEDSQLIADLHRISKKSPKLIRSTVYAAPSDPAIQIRSWKMNEFKYYDVPSPFPTLARGLFTRELEKEKSDDEPRYQIVARGYDKFFNIGEVLWTDWPSLKAHTGPKYTLSVKSNGCIIFISAISSSKLIVTSKHALGEMAGVPETHSQVGHRWLKMHLAAKGKTEEGLAAVLWEKNWTAVAELCDDTFEEHVLPYPPEKSGLHLHGINENHKEFRTLPTEVIDPFADEWGFLKTETITLSTISEVKEFTDEIAKTGKWKGEALEGFVVRTHIVAPNSDSKSALDKRPPYPIGSSFFFKVKFDEPYMMYRDWREVTKSLLSTKGSLNDAKLPKSKMKRKETQMYVEWVKKEIQTNRSAFKEFAKGKGIIATRERFLRWMDTEDGKTGIDNVSESQQNSKEFGKTIIVPVAVPGCGKTSVSIALAHLFGFGHTQSDDVQAKKSAPVFIKKVVKLLENHNVVIADKNNHLRQHREALRDAVTNMYPPVRLLALHWALDQSPPTIHRICGDRVLARGDKHQTLRADRDWKSHEDVILQFIRRAEELADNEVDVSIEMDIGESLEAAVTRAVDGCVDILGLERPSQDSIDEAVKVAEGYVPDTSWVKKPGKNPPAPPTPRYFAILPEFHLEEVIGAQIEEAEDVPLDGKAFWRGLVSDNRLPNRPHITLVHKSGLPIGLELWELCTVLTQMPTPPLFSFTLGHLVWNNKVMAITVEDFDLVEDPGGDSDRGQERHEFISKLPEEVRRALHITVGTSDPHISPFTAKGLVERWRNGHRAGIGSLELEGLSAKGRVRGLIS
ncbi:RNA ligase-domain-containing protein [Melanogaster broomeanus]|nr:RNA ligase-domain-containing protein [Melanogaster broomeanus]